MQSCVSRCQANDGMRVIVHEGVRAAGLIGVLQHAGVNQDASTTGKVDHRPQKWNSLTGVLPHILGISYGVSRSLCMTPYLSTITLFYRPPLLERRLAVVQFPVQFSLLSRLDSIPSIPPSQNLGLSAATIHGFTPYLPSTP